MAMGPQPKKNTEQAMIDDFLKKGGSVTKGKTKPMPSELGISNSQWNNKLSRNEKKAKGSK
jgi:hypothetical protein